MLCCVVNVSLCSRVCLSFAPCRLFFFFFFSVSVCEDGNSPLISSGVAVYVLLLVKHVSLLMLMSCRAMACYVLFCVFCTVLTCMSCLSSDPLPRAYGSPPRRRPSQTPKHSPPPPPRGRGHTISPRGRQGGDRTPPLPLEGRVTADSGPGLFMCVCACACICACVCACGCGCACQRRCVPPPS